MNIYKTSVKNPITTIILFITIGIMGMFSLSRLGIDLLPDIESNAMMVMTSYPGASAEDIENNVTRPVENVLNGVDHLKHITSNSKENISVVMLEFEYGYDIDVLANDVRDKLDLLTTLPDGVSQPTIFKFSSDMIPVLMVGVTAEESMSGLYKILDDQVATPLARVSGVGTVSIAGIPEREIQVYCNPNKLEAYGLTIESISAAISAANRNTPAGTFDVGSNVYSLRVDHEFEDPSELRHLVVGYRNGAPIYLSDVASIEDTIQERIQEAFINGEQGGMIIIQKKSGANAVEIATDVKEHLVHIQETLPSDVKLTTIVDTSDNIIHTVNSLRDTIATTFILVMLVVFLFLGRWRATIVVVLTIPISLLAAIVYILATGETLNIITMSSLSIAIGMVVDNAIVVLENITSHIDRGAMPKQAAIFATKEVGISVMGGTLTTIAVFLPLTMVTGMAGILFNSMGWMVTITLVVSTAAAITFTPVLCSLMMKKNPKKAWFQGKIDAVMEAFNKVYGAALKWCVTHRFVVLLGALLLFVGVMYGLGSQLKTEFFPVQDNAQMSATIELPVGTRQDITRELALELEKRIREAVPEIKTLSVREGQADSDNLFASMQDNGTHLITMNMALLKKTERERKLSEIGDVIRGILNEYSIIRTYNVNESGQRGGMGQSTVDIEVYGYDFDITDNLAKQIQQMMLGLDGCSEVTVSRDEYTPEYHVDFDLEKLAQNGIDVTTASAYLRNRINGSVTSYYREDGDEYDIRVRYDKPFRESIADIENITIYNSQGKGVKIRDLGKVVESYSPPTIERKDRERYITVTGVVATGYAMSEVIAATTEGMESIEFPAGYVWQLSGTYEDQQETFGDLFLLMALMIILVYVIMASQFESLVDPFVIMFSIPFAVVGVVIGLAITGVPLNVMSLLGILMLVGIVVNNGIVLIDYTILCRERGMGILEAVVTAGRSRLRPILMTTLTTVLGMIPMAVGNGVGSEMWNSLGMSVAWGLSFSTLITLIFIPTLYATFAVRGEKRRQKKMLKQQNS
ncbi:MAG: efflux RND transporter permease subunit [Rikenellaceae bacterium]|nr:efflux RND transporter permease subunit [Rikenellaceae bacterium]